MSLAPVQQIITDADRCVKCAVCLPHCPTYRLSGDEAESPRGRIALMRALADGTLAPGAGLTRHLDQCLACRNCEPVCPAQVPYGRLIANGRTLLYEHKRPGWFKRLGLWLVVHRRGLRALAWAVDKVQRAGLERLIPVTKRLPRVHPPPARARDYPALAKQRGRVGLFVGCVADVLDAATRDAAIRVLNHAGYHVFLPAAQGCCGALHRHAGDAARADRLAQINRQAFRAAAVESVISTATGCGAELAERSFPDGGHDDIGAFLFGDDAFRRVRLKPLTGRIAVYAPCTQRNVLGNDHATVELLRRIPKAEVVPVPAATRCCGAAGSYVLENRVIADRLGAQLAGRITELAPDYLACANIGCAMHLADHLKRLGANIEVLHPVRLIARQLP